LSKSGVLDTIIMLSVSCYWWSLVSYWFIYTWCNGFCLYCSSL